MQNPEKPGARRIIRAVLMAVFLLLFAVIFYVSVILANPQEDENPVRTDPPLQTAAPPAEMRSAADLPSLLTQFPGPALLATDGYTLIGGGMQDVPVSGGYARTLTLTYRHSSGRELTVRSIWPAKSEEVLDAAGWHLSQIAGQSIAGMPSLRLENGNTLRLQCQGTDALYTVETDLLSGEELAAMLQPLQLVEN